MVRKVKEPNQESYSGRCAARLRELRTKKNWTAHDVRTQLQSMGKTIGRSTYYCYESGERDLPLDLIPYLADLYNMTPRGLMPKI